MPDVALQITPERVALLADIADGFVTYDPIENRYRLFGTAEQHRSSFLTIDGRTAQLVTHRWARRGRPVTLTPLGLAKLGAPAHAA